MKTKKLKIILKDWSHTCGDGCCNNYGTKLYINGELQDHPESTKEGYIPNGYVGMEVPTAIASVLKYLGVEFEIEQEYD